MNRKKSLKKLEKAADKIEDVRERLDSAYSYADAAGMADSEHGRCLGLMLDSVRAAEVSLQVAIALIRKKE